ncbi:MAG: chromate transporter [Lachnospiraceae bacterium]
MTYLWLFLEFFKTGLFAIGGGMATLPFLYEIAEKYPWFTTHDLANMIAVSESTPGPIGVNMATYAGYMAEGIFGGIFATLSLVLPSVIIIMIVAKLLNQFNESKFVKGAFMGLKPAVTGLIAAATLEIFKISLLNINKYEISKKLVDMIDLKAVLLFIVVYLGIVKLKKHPILYILLGAVVGIIWKM